MFTPKKETNVSATGTVGGREWFRTRKARLIVGTAGGLAVLLLVGVFLAVGLPQLQPKPLVEKEPEIAAALGDVMPKVEDSIAGAEETIDAVTGKTVGPKAVDGETLSPAVKVFATTVLEATDPAVTRIHGMVSECESLLVEAEALLDPKRTLMGSSDQVDELSTPKIIASGVSRGVLNGLETCVTDLGASGEAAGTALNTVKAEEAGTQAAVDNQAARAALEADITEAQSIHDSSSGQVMDESTRSALAESIQDARDALSAEVPAAGWEAVDAQTKALVDTASSLQAPRNAVTASQQAWSAEQERIRQEREAAASHTSSGGSDSVDDDWGGGSAGGGTGNSGSTGSSNGGGNTGGSSGSTYTPPAYHASFVCGSTACTCYASNYSVMNYYFSDGWTDASARAAKEASCV